MIIVKEIIRSYYTCDDAVKIDIDHAIKILSDNGTLSSKELSIIHATKEQYSQAVIGEQLRIPSSMVGYNLDRACEKISEYLGEGYQDSKIILMVEEKLGRSLTSEEKEFCWFKVRNFRKNEIAKLNLFNFELKDGKFTKREDKAEG